MKNEKGFILPVTLMISILLFLVFSYQINMIISERLFNKETEELFVLENLMQLGLTDVLQEVTVHRSENEHLNSEFYYPNGSVTYRLLEEDQTTVSIAITCITKNERQYSAQFVYDKTNDEIINWLEAR